MYDLEDLKMWEPVLFGATSKKQLILEVAKKKGSKLMSRISCDEEVCMCVLVCVCAVRIFNNVTYKQSKWYSAAGGQF